jgi:NDP-sugar pyrophosphorylase family protein
MQKHLVVLAAGMGSRYGGLKQMDPVGPSGEFILDYSVYDALLAGFSDIVFVIRHDLEADFRRIVGRRWESRADVRYAFQELGDLPDGFTPPPGRTKPWGTGHAVLAARELLDSPFAVVNADDFYGRDAFATLAGFLDRTAADPAAYAMVAYEVGRTLSEHGSVSRGVCDVDARGRLTRIEERTAIARGADGVIRAGELVLPPDTPVSLNLFGFKPSFLGHLATGFRSFLAVAGKEPKSEYFMPTVVGDLITRRLATVDVLRTPADWFGVTNAADRPGVVARFAELAASDAYPPALFGA